MEESNDQHRELAAVAATDIEFRAETIYFLIIDRFACGSPHKIREDDEMFDAGQNDWHKYWGGDLQGVVDKLDYLRGLNISAIWTTPLFEQVQSMTAGDQPRAPIHGYWTSDFKRINPRWMNDPSEKRLFTRNDTIFDQLLERLHQHDMKFVLDIVCNHSSPVTGQGKGKLYDDGQLIADFDDDKDHWYHHYGDVTDWSDEWQVQNCELCGLATFNENNIKFRNYIKDAIRMWIEKGVDALRIDTVKHMPLWFWQEFSADTGTAKPGLFRFGEWMASSPDDARAVEFANQSGMSILDFGFCHALREVLAKNHPDGFVRLKNLIDGDPVYLNATELVTFFENHDMPRLQSLGASNETLHLALVILLTSRGVPCLYYGCEQYLHNDENGGDDPFNRPMMERWEQTPATKLIARLAAERKHNRAIQFGGQHPVWVDADSYIYLRRYGDARCLVMCNKGPDREIEVENVDFPDGTHECLITRTSVSISHGRFLQKLPANSALVLVRHDPPRSNAMLYFQVNRAPTQPGDTVMIIGDTPELGNWDLTKGVRMECINASTWSIDLPLTGSMNRAIAYKYVILPGDESKAPLRENRLARRRLIIAEESAKWRDIWEH